MFWYKHLTNSHDDPDISDAMDKFGDFGYCGFFILLDLYGQEFNHINNDGFLRISKTFLQRKLRKRWTKVELLLNFFSKEISEPRFLWSNNGNFIMLKVPKFIEVASNWTGRKIRKDLQSSSVAPTAKEVDIEVDIEKEKKRKEKKRKEKKELNTSCSNDNNDKNVKKETNKRKFGEHIFLTEQEYSKLIKEFTKPIADNWIERANLYAEKIGVQKFNSQYKSHYATIITWDIMKKEKDGVSTILKEPHEPEPEEERPGIICRIEADGRKTFIHPKKVQGESDR